MRRAGALGAALLTVVVVAVGCSSDDGPSFPEFTAPVVDEAGRVPDEVERRVSAALEDYQRRTTNQIAVAVIDTTGDASLENYGIDLAREWGVGGKDDDNGVLLLIALEDRRVRIDTGLQVDDELTDLESGRIINDRMVPLLRAGDIGAAVEQGANAIREQLGDPEVGALPAPPTAAPAEQPNEGPGGLALLPILLLFGAALAFGRRRGRGGFGAVPIIFGGGFGGGGFGGGGFGGGGFGGGGGGGGFGGGGGGGFGGGGASGGW